MIGQRDRFPDDMNWAIASRTPPLKLKAALFEFQALLVWVPRFAVKLKASSLITGCLSDLLQQSKSHR